MRLIYTALLFAAAATAQTTAIALPQLYASGPIGLNGLETARWNVLNAPMPAPIVGPACSVTLSFHDGQGNQIKKETVTLKAGESRSLSLLSTDFPSTGTPTGLYALATVPVTAPVDGQPTGSACTLVTTIEIVETSTGATRAVSKGEQVRPSGMYPANPIPLGRKQ